MKKLHESWIQYLTEGVQDKATLKVIFTAGSAGSGKTTVSSYILDYDSHQEVNTFTQTGLKISNIDMPFTVLLRQLGIDPKELSSLPKEKFEKISFGPGSVREKSRHLTGLALTSYKRQRLGVLIDGTGRDRTIISRMKKEFEDLGYDCMMIFVGVDLNQALERNRRRARTLPDDLITSIWKDVNNNLNYYSDIFGDNFVYVDNNTRNLNSLKQAKRKVLSFLEAPVQNPVGQEWLDSQRAA